jgi:hypothetical protein
VISIDAGALVEDGVVRAAVAEGHLGGLAAEGEGQELVAEADAEQGAAAQLVAQGLDDPCERGGVAGAVGQEHAVGVDALDGGGGEVGGHDVDRGSRGG